MMILMTERFAVVSYWSFLKISTLCRDVEWWIPNGRLDDCTEWLSMKSTKPAGVRIHTTLAVFGILHASIDFSGHASRRTCDKQPIHSVLSKAPSTDTRSPQPATSWQSQLRTLFYLIEAAASLSRFHASLVPHLTPRFAYLRQLFWHLNNLL